MTAYAATAAGLVAVALCGFCQGASAQAYPVKPVRIIVPLAPGGNVDIVACSLAQLFTENPGELSYATSGPGGTGHMATELFSRQVGVKMLHVPYKGNAQAIIDVIGGQVMLMFDQVSTSEPYIKAGKLRGLAVSSRARSPLFPTLPTIDEAGVPGFEDITFNGLVAPAGTPREFLARLNQEVARVVSAPALRNRFLERGVELKASASPEEFTAYIKAEFDKKGKLAREAGIRLE